MKSANLRVLSASLLIALCLSATNSWARLPKPVQISGVVLFVDHETKSLVFKTAKDKKPIVLDWDRETQFIKDGNPAAPATLANNASVRIHYKDLSFRNRLLKKVSWTSTNIDEGDRENQIQKR